MRRLNGQFSEPNLIIAFDTLIDMFISKKHLIRKSHTYQTVHWPLYFLHNRVKYLFCINPQLFWRLWPAIIFASKFIRRFNFVVNAPHFNGRALSICYYEYIRLCYKLIPCNRKKLLMIFYNVDDIICSDNGFIRICNANLKINCYL